MSESQNESMQGNPSRLGLEPIPAVSSGPLMRMQLDDPLPISMCFSKSDGAFSRFLHWKFVRCVNLSCLTIFSFMSWILRDRF